MSDEVKQTEIEEKKAEADLVEKGSKSWQSVAALAIVNIKWIVVLSVAVLITYGVFFSGWTCTKGTITKTATEVPHK